MPWLSASIVGLTLFVMLVGLLGLVVPIFPGIIVIWLAALGYGLVVKFNALGITIFVILTILMLIGVTVDNVMMGLGARKGGASWWSIALATLLGIAGTLVFPPFGGLIAAPLTVLVIEYLRMRNWRKVWGAIRGLAVGWGLSFAIRFAVGVLMILLWGAWVWLR